MTDRRIDVFFYGLFMDIDALRALGARAENPRIARVSNFVLTIGRRATLAPRTGSDVYGILMQLSHDEIERLYAEPGLRAYRPEAVTARLDDGTDVPALCFNLPEADRTDEFDEGYASKLRDLARRAGLPAGYVETMPRNRRGS